MVSDKSGVDSGFPLVNLRKVAKLLCVTRQIGADGSALDLFSLSLRYA